MAGETDLDKLIREIDPELNPGEYVFCTLKPGKPPADLELLGSFREKEGLTAILSRALADQAGLPYSFVGAWITLNVHSDLEAVGLTAAVSRALARAGISCNVVAGFYHDHLFVPLKDGNRAIEILRELARTRYKVPGG
jgi:hypothetical protein